MTYKMYDTGGIYHLDDERGKGKIYEIINKSKPKRVEKLISDSTFADAPTGTYYFYFDGYKLEATWSLGAIYVLLYFVHRCITHRLNLLMTLDYEGIYSYVAALPVGDDDIRLVFLDRIEPECRDWEKRYGDPELEKTVAAKDIIISRYEFIKQFNDEIKKVYDDNKYYLSEEYKNECKKKGETICQEYVLEVFADYIKIFDKYIENPEQFLKDSFFNRDNWYAPIYATVSDLKKQFDEWKNIGVCIGSKIEKIMVMGTIFNDDRPYYTLRKGKWYTHIWDPSKKNNIRYEKVEEGPTFDPNRNENVSLRLDEPLSIFIKNSDDITQHLDIDFTKTARFMMKPDFFDFWEQSYIKKFPNWQDVSKYFSKNIIGHKIIDINIESFGREDDENIDLVEFVMDNSYKLCLESDLWTGYMCLYEDKGEI